MQGTSSRKRDIFDSTPALSSASVPRSSSSSSTTDSRAVMGVASPAGRYYAILRKWVRTKST